MEASSDLWKAESVFYPSAIHETTSVSSETVSVPQEAEAAQSEAAQIIVTPGKSTKGGEPHAAIEAPGGLNLEMAQVVALSANRSVFVTLYLKSSFNCERFCTIFTFVV